MVADPIPDTVVVGTESATTQDERLWLLCRYLAGRCNGASTEDGVGFSKFDAAFGHDMAERPPSTWTAWQRFKLYRTLSRYRQTQLAAWWHQIAPVANPYEQPVPREGIVGAALDAVMGPSPRPTRTFQIVTQADGAERIEVTLVPREPGFDAALTAIKALPGRVYDPDRKRWLLPLTAPTLEPMLQVAEQHHFTVPAEVAERAATIIAEFQHKVDLSRATSADVAMPGLGIEPFGFQKAGILYAERTPNVMIADEPGLGKTGQALVTLFRTNSWPALVVCPASIKAVWRREAPRWLPLLRQPHTVAVIDGKCTATVARRLDELRQLEEAVRQQERTKVPVGNGHAQWGFDGLLTDDDVVRARRDGMRLTLGSLWPLVHPDLKLVIINYDVLNSWKTVLRQMGFQAVVADEAHNMKNASALRTQAFEYVARGITRDEYKRRVRFGAGVPRTILLTGTPVVNNPLELYVLMRLADVHEAFGDYRTYQMTYGYANPATTYGAEKLTELHQLCRERFLVRRRKQDVLTDLPDKLRTVVPIELTNADAYLDTEHNVAAYFAERTASDEAFLAQIAQEADFLNLTGDDRAVFLDRLTKERYAAAFNRAADMNEALLKWEALKTVCVEGKMAGALAWIEEFLASGKKLVVFGWHTAVVERIATHFKAPAIMGRTKTEDRARYVDAFQHDPGVPLIVGNIRAMGEGLTLTAASDVAFLEFGWNPKDQQQAEDRCHRIGQTDSVTVWSLVGVLPEEKGTPVWIDHEGTKHPYAGVDHAVDEDTGDTWGEPWEEARDIETIDSDLIDLIAAKQRVVDAVQDGIVTDGGVSLFAALQARLAERSARRQTTHEGGA